MKCRMCLDEVIKHSRDQVGKNRAKLAEHVRQFYITEAVTANGWGEPLCLKHYIEREF